MNPPCARCKKTVYPVEKLNCLDKVWHKKCFTCETCNLKLTMNTYKGYNKLPYCKAHYPTTKFTAVANTPEALRLAKQQRNQSAVEYKKKHEDDLKGFTQVSDTVQNRQASAASRLASQIGYQQPPPQPTQQYQPPPQPTQQYQPPPQPTQQYQPPPQPTQQYQPPPQPTQQYQPPPPQPTQQYQPPSQPTQQYQPSPTPVYAPPPPDPEPYPEPVPAAAPPPTQHQERYVALYDYSAADDDEISFEEGDVMIEVQSIDEGWMEGRNSKTGQYGMFPSNYVEAV